MAVEAYGKEWQKELITKENFLHFHWVENNLMAVNWSISQFLKVRCLTQDNEEEEVKHDAFEGYWS